MIRNFAAVLVVALLAYGQGVAAMNALAVAKTTQMDVADCGCHDADGGCDPSKDRTCDWGAGCALRCGLSTGFTVIELPLPVVHSPGQAVTCLPTSRPDSISSSPPLRPPRFSIFA